MPRVTVKLHDGTTKEFYVLNRASFLFERDEDGKLVNVYESSTTNNDADYVEIDIIIGEDD
jgi:hypothetical protein